MLEISLHSSLNHIHPSPVATAQVNEGWAIRGAALLSAVQYAVFAVAGEASTTSATVPAPGVTAAAPAAGGYVAIGPGRPSASNPVEVDPSVLDGFGVALPQVEMYRQSCKHENEI